MKSLRWPNLMAVVWWLRRCAWTLGWIPMIASVALSVVWLVLLQQKEAQETQFDALQQEIRQLAIKPEKQPAHDTPVAIEKVQPVAPEPVQLASLWQQLPAFSDLSPRMMHIASLAQKRQIPLNVGDYQWQAHQVKSTSHDIQQFDMRFTIQADYVTCRQFIIDVLREYPAMGLTGLELRKNETVQPMVDATLTFSVFIRGGQAHAS